jgi:hypothetical protein
MSGKDLFFACVIAACIGLAPAQITELPPGIFERDMALESLAIDSNQISNLPPDSFKGMDALVHIDFSGLPQSPSSAPVSPRLKQP